MKYRVISVCIAVLALAAFQPFGLPLFGWMRFVHLLALGVVGVLSCGITEVLIMLLGYGRSMDKGIKYLVRRNQLFALVNTPLVTLCICVYRHFLLNSTSFDNSLNWHNYLETFIFMAFCSFVIGLYWKNKFRSKFLEKELEETLRLNSILEERQRLTEERNGCETAGTKKPNKEYLITLGGTTKETVALDIRNLLYLEALGNYVKVEYLQDGKVQTQMLRTTIKQLIDDLSNYPAIMRCHRAYVININQMDHVDTHSANFFVVVKHCLVSIPVSKSYLQQIKEAIKHPAA